MKKYIFILIALAAISIVQIPSAHADTTVASTSVNINFGSGDNGGNLGFSFNLNTAYSITGFSASSTGITTIQNCNGGNPGCAPTTMTIDGNNYVGNLPYLGMGPFTSPISLSSGPHTVTWTYSGTGNRSTIFVAGGSAHIDWLGVTASSFIPTPASIEFKYPTQGATTPLFSPWLLKIGSATINDNDFYQARIQWYATEHNTSTTLSRTLTGIAYGTGAQFVNSGISIPRSDFGIDFSTSTDVYAFAQLYDTQDPNNSGASLANPIMVASTSISFFLQSIPQSNGDFITPVFGTTTNDVTTSTRPVGAVENPTIGLPGSCTATSTFDFWSPSDWGCIFQNNINDLIAKSAAFGNGTVDTVVGKVKQVWPLNIFVQLNADIDAAEASSTDPGDITLVGHGTVFPGRTFVIFSSSTTAWVAANTGFDYKTFISRLMYLATAIIMLLQVALLIKGMNSDA